MFTALSGTVGDLTFKTRNGQTFMYQKPDPQLPEHPTPKQRARYRKQLIVAECVKRIQGRFDDMLTAISSRKTIYNRVARLYDKLAPTVRARTKLIRAILDEYARFA